MESIHIDLHGFSDEDVAELRAFLASNDAVADVYEAHAMEASSVREVLTATLADTTLVAQVLKEVAGAVVSVSAIVQAIKAWIDSRKKSASQHATVTIHSEERSPR